MLGENEHFPSLLLLAYSCSLILSSSVEASVTQQQFECDFSNTSAVHPVWSFWESCTTGDHAYLALRSDYQEQLTQVHNELNIEYIRFHGIFDDDVGILNSQDPSMGYSYANIDKIYDFFVSIGIKPVVELDFAPSLLSTINTTLNNYYYPVYPGPPKDNQQWYYLVRNFTQHLTDRYGSDNVSQWYFEAWNEPNCGNWRNTDGSSNDSKLLESFEETYVFTSKAVKSVNSSYKIGGPATCRGSWFDTFPRWAIENGIELDYYSTHLYPGNANSNANTHNGLLELYLNVSDSIRNVSDNKIKIGITAYGCTVEKTYNHSVGSHDSSYNAACFLTLASQFQELELNNPDQFIIMSFTGFTDIWEQRGILYPEFHNGYGWLTHNKIKKPTYCGLQLLNMFASGRYFYNNIERLNSNSSELNTTLEVFITMDNKTSEDSNEIVIFVMNWIQIENKINDETVRIDLENIVNSNEYNDVAIVYRIDKENNHCNPNVVWQNMGSPTNLDKKQLKALNEASEMGYEMLNVTGNNGNKNGFSVTVDVPKYGVAAVVIQRKMKL